jgi:hypothetical protein
MKVEGNGITLLIVITFLLGGASGWLIGRNTGSGISVVAQAIPDTARTRHIVDSTVQVKITRESDSLSLERAIEFRDNYARGAFQPQPKTTSVIHSYSDLKAYIATLPDVYTDMESMANMPGSSRGVAFYFAKSYPGGNYLQERRGKVSCLLQDNNSIFLMPVLYNETNSNLFFPFVNIDGTWRPGEWRDVSTIGAVWTPLLHKAEIEANAAKKPHLINFLREDPIGFDLGHTQP